MPTYPFKGSKFHVVLFQNIFVGWFNFSFENSFGRRGKRPQRHEIWEESEVSRFYLKEVKVET